MGWFWWFWLGGVSGVLILVVGGGCLLFGLCYLDLAGLVLRSVCGTRCFADCLPGEGFLGVCVSCGLVWCAVGGWVLFGYLLMCLVFGFWDLVAAGRRFWCAD